MGGDRVGVRALNHTQMSRVYLASDLHAEMGARPVRWPPDSASAVLLLAGDVGRVSDGSWRAAVADAASKHGHVVAVLGNHEYHSSKGRTAAELEATARDQVACVRNATLLQREAVATPLIRVLGCTLWSDTAGMSPDGLTDYRRVYTEGSGKWGGHSRLATPDDTAAWHARDRAWLLGALASEAEPAIVLTHHAPTLNLNPAAHADSPFTRAFASEVPLPPGRVALACSGHTHGRLAAPSASGVPCVAHCRGYPGEHPGAYAPLQVWPPLAPAPAPTPTPRQGRADLPDEPVEWM